MSDPASQLISVFDTSICDNNLGNQIIMEAVEEQLHELFPTGFFLRLPYLDSIGPESIRYIQESAHVFFGGTNALSAEMETYRQWGLDASNARQIRNVVLFGVGWWQYQDAISDYTADILRQVLHDDRQHSVRDSYTKRMLAKIGIDNVLVTGCPSMWSLSAEHCASIPRGQARDVLLTFTNYSQHASDRDLFTTLARLYRDVFVWVQGPEDLAYARGICGDRAHILPPNLASLDRLFASHPSLDYVGTRLHAGIRSLTHGRRSLIIGVDNRALEKGTDFGLPVLPRTDLGQLEATVVGDRATEIDLPEGQIRAWKNQFRTTVVPQPTSRSFGFDRGQPIDRHYIESFLEAHRASIRGRVLEVADGTYSERFGSQIERLDILHAEPSDGATIVGRLEDPGTLPESAFDCIILTQTLNVVRDPAAVLRNAARALAPGGCLLVTAPGISQISRYDMDRWGDFWRFTDRSLRELLGDAIPGGTLEVEAHGNVEVAQAFLDGRAAHEIDPALLGLDDPDYPVLLAACARKPRASVRTRTCAPTVLIYHRVADDPIDANLLCVSPHHFAEQMSALARERVVPLETLLREHTAGLAVPGTFALTFDDGYLDVLENALPILAEHRLHATVFVASGAVDAHHEFWWDALERVLLTGESLPAEISLQDRGEQTWPTVTPSERIAVHDHIAGVLRRSAPEEIATFLGDLFAWAGLDREMRASHRTLSTEQLRRLDASPWIEIGAHTVDHPCLAALPRAEQQRQIEESKRTLEAILGHRVRLFSYPFGSSDDFTPETIELATTAGFQAAIANVQGRLAPTDDLFAIPRLLVRGWPGAVFADWLLADEPAALEQQTVARRHAHLLAAQQVGTPC